MVATSPTQMLSQAVVQQNGSAPQIDTTQFALVLSHMLTSAAPGVHSGWLQVPSDSVQVRLLHTVRTSEMQRLSHMVVQQNGSAAQIDDTHALEVLTSGMPVVHRS